MYCPILVNRNLLGEEMGKGTSSREDQGTDFMALDIIEKYQSQIHWPLERLEGSVALRQSEHGELCSVACIYTVCYCMCVCVCVYVCIYMYILLLCIFSVLEYIGVFVFNLCLCRL